MGAMGPYPIPLLNQLHHHFPDLLYAQEQFTTVQSVLQYIRRVAQQNPYDRLRQLYQPPPPLPTVSSGGFPSSFSSLFRARPSAAPASSSSPHPRPHVRPTGPISRPFMGDSISIQSMSIPLFSVEEDEKHAADDRLPINELLRFLVSGEGSEMSPTVPTAQQLETFTEVETLAETQDECCSICHEAFEQGQEVRRLLHCSHLFHRVCVDTWFTSHVTCPNCRHDIRIASPSD